MARLPRLVLPGIPHHVTQRGNRRERTFFEDDDYALYLELAVDAAGRSGVEIWSYCLTPNHVQLIAVPPVTVISPSRVTKRRQASSTTSQ